MNIIIQGPQASGKGTQARLLAEEKNLMHFEMGKILRSIANSDNEHAEAIKKAQNSGSLVPDEFVRLVAWDFVSKHYEQGIIFEGYPRSVAQYEHLQDMLRKFNRKIDYLISIDIPESESIKRISDRRTCQKCGRVYSLAIDGDLKNCECGGELILREDDKPEAVKHRLEIYHAQTRPVWERAKQEGIACEVDGLPSISEVHQSILKCIK